jgi:glycosyltransferase involved in cell wall biosynthesis
MITTLHVGDTSHLEGVVGRLARMYDRSIGRWILGCSWHVVAVSKAVMCYAEELGVPSSRLSMIPNAVDLEEFSTERETSSGNVIRVGFVGRLLSNKGPQYLVEAAGKAVRECPKLEFLLVGNGPMRKQLDQQITRLGLNNRFHFLGAVPNVSEFMKRCDIFVRPSLTEGMPLTVLEAMACGVPTIASRVGGTPELIVDGENGFLIEPRNTDELCDRLLRLGLDEGLRRMMGLRSRAYVEKHNSWAIVAMEISPIYQKLLNTTSR